MWGQKMVKVRGVEIGGGVPKICVPIAEEKREDILNMAKKARKSPADIVEWRVDFYEDALEFDAVIKTAEMIKDVLADTPLLATFRTRPEGGKKEIGRGGYECLLKGLAASGHVDMIDVEACRLDGDPPLIGELGRSAAIVGSYHDFLKTPSVEEMLKKFEHMDKCGADILKIAVMPKERRDVARLMEASVIASDMFKKKAVVAISMSGLGLVSRIAAQSIGSAITFASLGRQSAPGQIDASVLKSVLDAIEKNA